jgi:hypothetical protein
MQKEFDKANEAQLALEISRARGKLDGIVANQDPDCRLPLGFYFFALRILHRRLICPFLILCNLGCSL